MSNNYWSNKNILSQKAKEHYELMESKYKKEINNSISLSRIYLQEFHLEPKILEDKDSILMPMNTVDALFNEKEKYWNTNKKICVMNFASYKNPGGKFLEGSSAQEESLCHSSTLYNVLNCFVNDYYMKNLKHLNRALYTNRALYSPKIIFFKDDMETSADVLTCAAPNVAAYMKYNKVADDTIVKVLQSRITFIRDILIHNKVEIFIYGAFGCGVFGNSPYDVAEISKNVFKNSGIQVVYAIPYSVGKNSESNYKAFMDVI